jgi:hypothetical protein
MLIMWWYEPAHHVYLSINYWNHTAKITTDLILCVRPHLAGMCRRVDAIFGPGFGRSDVADCHDCVPLHATARASGTLSRISFPGLLCRHQHDGHLRLSRPPYRMIVHLAIPIVPVVCTPSLSSIQHSFQSFTFPSCLVSGWSHQGRQA